MTAAMSYNAIKAGQQEASIRRGLAVLRKVKREEKVVRISRKEREHFPGKSGTVEKLSPRPYPLS